MIFLTFKKKKKKKKKNIYIYIYIYKLYNRINNIISNKIINMHIFIKFYNIYI